MSIAVLISVHDGLVLAADSASTLMIGAQVPGAPGPAPVGVGNVYDNANKIFNLIKGKPVGCITFGTGSIGNASVETLMKDFRQWLSENENKFSSDYTMQRLCELLGQFLGTECDRELKDPVSKKGTTIGFFVGGYSKGEGLGKLGESWGVEIKEGVVQAPKKLKEDAQPGIVWGGQGEIINRIVNGYSPRLFQALSQVGQPQQTPQSIAQALTPLLNAQLNAPLAFAPMPIQDAIELGRFLVHSAIMFSRYSLGPQVVGGPIEIAAITKHEGFKWISRKHYYDSNLNKEPIHVICDRRSENTGIA
jgi:hypothetical protein